MSVASYHQTSALSGPQDEVVRLLTKSNRITFECLKIFFQKDKPGRGWKGIFRGSPASNAYDIMKNRAEVYLRVVDTSVIVTSAGVRIAKMIIAVVEASEDLEVSTITGVKQSAAENAKDAKRIQEDFRQLRGSLMNFHRALNPRSPPILGRMPENSFVEKNGLETMADEDFFAFTTQIIDQFLATVTEFIEWWSGLMSELAGVEDYMKRLKPGREDSGHRLFIAKLWKSIESEYKTYNADVTAQQDYYRPELNEVLRKKSSFFNWRR